LTPDWLLTLLSYDAKFIFWLTSTMIGTYVVFGKGWAKTILENRFESFWKSVGMLFLSIVFLVIISDPATAQIEAWLVANTQYAIGATTGVIGAFFVWLVVTSGYDIKTQWKWVVPAICFGITLLNWFVLRT
jgi:hypothetical protein